MKYFCFSVAFAMWAIAIYVTFKYESSVAFIISHIYLASFLIMQFLDAKK